MKIGRTARLFRGVPGMEHIQDRKLKDLDLS